MKLRHIPTGDVIDVPCLIKGENWEVVEPKKTTPKKKKTNTKSKKGKE